MEYIKIGYTSATHGLKGEVKIKSNFPYKNKVFKINNELYLGDEKEKITINSHRIHKNIDMITFNNYNDINEVLKYLRKDVYIIKESLELNDNEVLDSDLLTYKVLYKDKEGTVLEVFKASEMNKIIRLSINNKEVLIPYNDTFVKNIDKSKKTIEVELLENM